MGFCALSRRKPTSKVPRLAENWLARPKRPRGKKIQVEGTRYKMITRSTDSLLSEHWKRKQRLKCCASVCDELLAAGQQQGWRGEAAGESNSISLSAGGVRQQTESARKTTTTMIDILRSSTIEATTNVRRFNCARNSKLISNANLATCSRRNRSQRRKRPFAAVLAPASDEVTGLGGDVAGGGNEANCNNPASNRVPTQPQQQHNAPLITFTHRWKPCSSRTLIMLTIMAAALLSCLLGNTARGQSLLQSDPRPTIYSGDVSYGLLLSAHSSLGAELSTSASHQVVTLLRVDPPENFTEAAQSGPPTTTTVQPPPVRTGARDEASAALAPGASATTSANITSDSLAEIGYSAPAAVQLEAQFQLMSDSILDELLERHESKIESHPSGDNRHSMSKRQIFERAGQHRRQPMTATNLQQHKPAAAQNTQQAAASDSGVCSQVNANALYAGMGAIWASHQANLVGDSQLTVGTYVYDSCNDLEVGQRQSVRIVSNLNAFQQTTCAAPRGAPISLTIAHGDNQLRAIQLLTSFRVPVISTREHFALEDYSQLTRDQRRFLFSAAHSSRHLAVGALRFSKRIVTRSVSSPKLPNQFHKMSSKNGLIVISRNLPARFIAYLTEMIPNHVNYEMLQSNQPIDQIRSVEALESILIKGSASESKIVLSRVDAPPPPPTASGGAQPAESPRRVPAPKAAGGQLRSGRSRRSDDPDSMSSADNLGSEFDTSADEPDNSKMLSPTILMFITPSEAIDLVTRLRNDLAEVSRYYSLIVTTREDISPALKTIFHRGGSRLCSGKAFYTISPKPDDIGEFSRYFRDTVQMEGETSDHPLVCEFAKYQATSKIAADLDDISTEPVIKAVWSAAAAFKSVHRRECASLATTPLASSGGSGAADTPSATAAAGGIANARVMSGRQLKKTPHEECLEKMKKNMSNLVQRALKRLDVTINSTGLQSLDGFRLKFDDLNELMTNKFSIKYINKDCEITEIGQYSGFKDSSLRIDEETLSKSLEGSMPDPWPANVKPATSSSPATPATTSRPTSSEPAKDASSDSLSDSTSGNDSSESPSMNKNRRKGKRGGGGDASSSSHDDSGKALTSEDEDTTPTIAGDSSDLISESPKRNKKRSKSSADEKLPKSRKSSDVNNKKKQLVAAPITALGGKNILPGLTDTDVSSDPRNTRALSQNGSSTSATVTSISTAAITIPSSQKPGRKLKPFPTPAGTTFKDWLPIGETLTTANTRLDYQTTTKIPAKFSDPSESPITTTTTTNATSKPDRAESNSDEYLDELIARPTTLPPVQSTLPESDGNADLETIPAKSASRVAKAAGRFKLGRALQTSATTQSDSTDYVTSSSISTNLYNNQQQQPTLAGRQPYPLPYQSLEHQVRSPLNFSAADGDLPIVDRNQDYLRDLNASPIPLSSTPSRLPNLDQGGDLLEGSDPQSSEHRSGRFKIRTVNRSQMRWIYSSWYALTILGANICGALLTLYVLTFLLMRNCDGSLDRDNQGIRSIHLLAIIVVFFGSTLFIVYPTPGLCLLRTSWHNFALVMLFGSLLLQAMQIRSLGSLGLGGRPNRLNQFLTLIFMVGVQVSFEIQRWKYESANYINFVNQYFGGISGTSGDRRFMILNHAISDHFNPLNSFNDQVTPANIQISEHYQNLLQDYCLQQEDDFLQSQLYLCMIVGLLVIFSASNRRKRRLTGGASSTNHKLKSHLTSGKLVASQHEANLNLSPNNFQFANSADSSTANLFLVTIISAFTYSISIVLHIYGHNTANRDLIASVTMVSIAFTALIGIFLPILLQIHRYDSVIAADHLLGSSLSRPVVAQSKLPENQNSPSSPSTSAFTLFPEFAPTGLRRPASTSGESSSGAGSRRTFADTKESRRNMGAALANLGPTADSLRSMGFYTTDRHVVDKGLNPSLLNLKLNLSAIDEPCSSSADNEFGPAANEHQPHYHNHHQHQHQTTSNRKHAKGEKRLIMLDVDPCCPRHGVGAWPKIDEHSSTSKGARLSKTCNK